MNEARALMARLNCTWDEAWQGTMRAKPDLYKAMLQPLKTVGQFANNRADRAPNPLAPKLRAAQEEFINSVHKRMADRREEYDPAYQFCRKYARVMFDNDENSGASAGQRAIIMGMNVNSEADEVACAEKANGKAYPFDGPAIVKALIAFWKGKDGGSEEAIKAELLRRHPTLMTSAAR